MGVALHIVPCDEMLLDALLLLHVVLLFVLIVVAAGRGGGSTSCGACVAGRSRARAVAHERVCVRIGRSAWTTGVADPTAGTSRSCDHVVCVCGREPGAAATAALGRLERLERLERLTYARTPTSWSLGARCAEHQLV